MHSETMQPAEPEIEQLAAFLHEFNSESDRGAALTAAAYLEESLEDILRQFLAAVKETERLLSGYNAPLGTFSAKASAAFSLGLIQRNEYEELSLIRRVRNEFAHSWHEVDFTANKVVGLCSNLPWLGPDDPEIERTPRSRFNFAVAILLIDLLWRARLVKKEQRIVKEWPHRARGDA